MSDEISLAFASVCELATTLGARNIKDLPGCWETQIDGRWYVAVNGHNVETKTSRGAEVPPFHCYVEFNGWPAGIFSPRGGVIAAGAAANEDTFVAACQKRIDIERAKHAPPPAA